MPYTKQPWKTETIGRAVHEGEDPDLLAERYGIMKSTVHAHGQTYRRKHGLPSQRREDWERKRAKACRDAKAARAERPAPMAPFSRERAKKIRGNQQAAKGSSYVIPIEVARCSCGVVVPVAQLDDHMAEPTRCELAVRRVA